METVPKCDKCNKEEATQVIKSFYYCSNCADKVVKFTDTIKYDSDSYMNTRRGSKWAR